MQDTEVFKEKNAQFKCHVVHADADVKWFHNDKEVTEGKKYTKVEDGAMRCLKVMSCVDEDRGIVTAMVGQIKTEANLTVNGILYFTHIHNDRHCLIRELFM